MHVMSKSSTVPPSGNSQINWYYKRLANTYSTSVFISITGNQTSSPLWFFLADRHRSFFFFFSLKIFVYLIIVKVIKVKLLTLNKVASSGKDKYFFFKKLQIIHVVSSECLLVNKKNDVKNGSK